MPFKIRNWKLLGLAILCILFFTRLGFWQLSRAKEKQILLTSFAERSNQTALNAANLSESKDFRFYPAKLIGRFDNAHTVLLDNKIQDGKIGYEIYTPFKPQGITLTLLVDRGFIPIGPSRRNLPFIKPIDGDHVILKGILNLPPTYVALGPMQDKTLSNWPLRIEYLNMKELAKLLSYPLYSYVLNLSPNKSQAYAVKWQIVTMPPEKHKGYALQWFALALTVAVVTLALNRK